ncbi:PDZ domain-containing protein [Sphingomonas sp. SFZ2018-12]|nr:PDZ domain-containing protein [Sphingomonas sp. SFZ2018-12]
MRCCVLMIPATLLASAVPASRAEPVQRRAKAVEAATPVPVAVTLAPDAEARWVAFQTTPGNQLLFDVEINGVAGRAILDTGVSHTVVSTEFAGRAGLAPAGEGRAIAIGGQINLRWGQARQVRIGGLTRTGGRVGILPLAAAATATASPIDALVGADILSCCALDIDYDARRFRLLPSGRLPYTGARAPLRLSADRQVYVSELMLGAQTVRPVLIDTGDGSSVTVTRPVWQRARVATPGLTTTLAYGLGGPVVSQMAIVPELRVATLAAHNVEVRIEPQSGFAASTGTTGRIGSGFLMRYRVLLDPMAGHMIFVPGARALDVPKRSTSGLLLGQQTGRLKVLHVMANSPAAKAGWHVDDLICAVDGKDVTPGPTGSTDVTWLTDTPGRVVTLALCDGRVRELTLRRFY